MIFPRRGESAAAPSWPRAQVAILLGMATLAACSPHNATNTEAASASTPAPAAAMPAFNSPVAPPASPAPIFACSLGTKQVSITGSAAHLTYKFGTTTKTEISLEGGPTTGNVFFHKELGARYALSQLRFTNGPANYVVYYSDVLPDAIDHSGGEQVAGLLVIQGKKALAKLTCRGDADPFNEDIDLTSLHDDTTYAVSDYR